MLQILKMIACIFTALIGFYALFAPAKILDFTGLAVQGGRGITEIRVIFGALFVVIGLFPLISRSPAAYQMLGYTYLGLGAARLVSIVVDRSATQSNWVSVAFEIVFGILLIL